MGQARRAPPAYAGAFLVTDQRRPPTRYRAAFPDPRAVDLSKGVVTVNQQALWRDLNRLPPFVAIILGTHDYSGGLQIPDVWSEYWDTIEAERVEVTRREY